ncbi:TonB-dependent receptor [Spongiibacter sp. KMU-158]|uniref:TonB-dependent receptor n=1 Tax=Spongiibacter pelagi TaxID=2760804 RepID=A0A927BZI9_9GAMM|nr:TonB-dependent receptor [Spongiibacter pelagi]MBD2857934.1 TonB-dependent receptor [Spongiibacter pelagi]
MVRTQNRRERQNPLRVFNAALPILALSVSVPGYAQIEEVLVTAQKREQSLSDVPININAMSGDKMAELNIQQFDDLANFVPGLEVQEQSANNPAFVIRGITSDSGEAFIEPRIAIFQDGVPSSRSRGSFFELHDLERVEVVKGPQSTLFGRAALIGGINVIQRKADYEWDGQLKLGYGESVRSTKYKEIGAQLGGPIIDETLAARVSLIKKSRDPYVENLLGGEGFNGADVEAWRVSLRFDPLESLRIDLIANSQEDTPPGTGFKNNRFAPPGGDTSPYSGAALQSFGGFRNNAELGLERSLDSVTGIVAWEINDTWTFTAISGVREFESEEVFDADGSHHNILVAAEVAEGEQFSQELRFNYDAGGDLTAFFGANYLDESGSQYVPVATDATVGIPFFLNFLATGEASEPVLPASGILYEEEFSNGSESQSIDLFGDATWRFSEKLELTAGIRWTRDDKSTSYYGRSKPLADLSALPITLPIPVLADPGSTLFIAASENGEQQEASDTFSGLSWRTVLAYHFTEDFNAWASYARGRRPEVIAFNTPAGGSFVEPQTLDAELVDSIEVGGFLSLFENKLNISGSTFYYEYTNFQTTIYVPGEAAVEVLNAGSASSYGLEIQVDGQINENISAFFSYGYNHGRFADKDDSGQEQQFAGNHFRLSPDHSAAIGATFRLPTRYGIFSATPSYSYKSKYFFDDNNDRPDLQEVDSVQDEFQPAYGLLDMTLSYEIPDGRFAVEIFGKNLLDEDYLLDAGNTGDSFGLPTFIPGPDRLIGLSFTARL